MIAEPSVTTTPAMIRSFEGTSPTIAPTAHVDEAAVVIGDVVLEAEANVWPNVVLRGDTGQVVVGERSNVQDGAILHEDAVLEADTTVGHSAIVHDARVADGALVGMNATVLDNAHVGENAVVGAGAVVTEGTEVPPDTLVTGVPAEPKGEVDGRPGTAQADHYVDLSARHAQGSEHLD
jgi:carbonic anhydrase/acetyltransferase-like protein (isoleucine patch superfamily)